MRICIHFGIHRTGSTSIQECLSNSYNILKSHGYLYPRFNGMHSHVELPWMLNRGEVSVGDIIGDIKKQRNQLTHTVVLSAEDFCLVKDSTFFSGLGKEYDVEAVVYLKRQDIWLESWYNQHIKWPWDKNFSSTTPSEFLRSHDKSFPWIDYFKLIKKIENYVGRESLYVNVVDGAGVSNTVSDFLNYLSIDSRWLNSYSDKNASLSSAKLDVLRRIDAHALSGKARLRIIDALHSVDIAEDDGSKLVFNDSQVKEILNFYEGSNRKVAREYFSREKLFEDPVKLGRHPVFVSDDKAYKHYIPQLLKEISEI